MLTSKIEKKRFKRNVKINFTLDHEKYLPRLEAKILRISFFLSRKVYSSILKESRMIYDEREKEREREGERESCLRNGEENYFRIRPTFKNQSAIYTPDTSIPWPLCDNVQHPSIP